MKEQVRTFNNSYVNSRVNLVFWTKKYDLLSISNFRSNPIKEFIVAYFLVNKSELYTVV